MKQLTEVVFILDRSGSMHGLEKDTIGGFNSMLAKQKEIEGEINSINVNKNGYVSIIISGTSYKTVIKNFDVQGKELFTKYLATSNVIDTDISSDNKYLAIAEANFSGIVVQSIIKIISIEDAKNNSSESIQYTHLAEVNDLIINTLLNQKSTTFLFFLYLLFFYFLFLFLIKE